MLGKSSLSALGKSWHTPLGKSPAMRARFTIRGARESRLLLTPGSHFLLWDGNVQKIEIACVLAFFARESVLE